MMVFMRELKRDREKTPKANSVLQVKFYHKCHGILCSNWDQTMPFAWNIVELSNLAAILNLNSKIISVFVTINHVAMSDGQALRPRPNGFSASSVIEWCTQV